MGFLQNWSDEFDEELNTLRQRFIDENDGRAPNAEEERKLFEDADMLDSPLWEWLDAFPHVSKLPPEDRLEIASGDIYKGNNFNNRLLLLSYALTNTDSMYDGEKAYMSLAQLANKGYPMAALLVAKDASIQSFQCNNACFFTQIDLYLDLAGKNPGSLSAELKKEIEAAKKQANQNFNRMFPDLNDPRNLAILTLSTKAKQESIIDALSDAQYPFENTTLQQLALERLKTLADRGYQQAQLEMVRFEINQGNIDGAVNQLFRLRENKNNSLLDGNTTWDGSFDFAMSAQDLSELSGNPEELRKIIEKTGLEIISRFGPGTDKKFDFSVEQLVALHVLSEKSHPMAQEILFNYYTAEGKDERAKEISKMIADNPFSATEGKKTEEPKAEKPKTEEPKTEEPKSEKPKTEEPKTEEPKVEKPKEEKKAEAVTAKEPPWRERKKAMATLTAREVLRKFYNESTGKERAQWSSILKAGDENRSAEAARLWAARKSR